ncbi:MAG: hypothetical protein ACK5W9_13350 [Bdellovibrionales bacterium]
MEKIRLRFAPFELSTNESLGFNQFREKQIKLYGDSFGLRTYPDQVCRYFFGSYSPMELPNNIENLNQLLKECPLRPLENIKLSPGPRPDCAPAAVHCEPYSDPADQPILDKITCGRIL